MTSEIMIFVAVILGSVLVVFILKPKRLGKVDPPPKKEIPLSQPQDQAISEPGPRYSKRDLLTPHEKENYIRLKSVTDKLGLEIFAKVRLCDLFKPNEDRSDSQRLLNWTLSKHIDFVIWNPVNNTVVLLLEIWDSSHKTPDRKRRDDFVRDIANEVGYNFAMYPEVISETMEWKLTSLLKGRL